MRKPHRLQNRLSTSVEIKTTTTLDVVIFSSILLATVFAAIFIYGTFGTSKKTFASLGMHGGKTVNATNVIVNEFTTLASSVSAGAASISVASSSLNANARFAGNLTAGELVMIIQMQGATMNTASASSANWGAITAYNNAGKFELNEVANVPNSTTINLVSALVNSYSSSGQVQVIRVPRYSSMIVNAGASLTTQVWNGSTGGVLIFESNGSTVINGTIDVSGKGFRGGSPKKNTTNPGNHTIYASTSANDGAEKGEGIGGSQSGYDLMGGRYGRGASANGGGGGNSYVAGGGGGSNSAISLSWNGNGNPDTVTNSSWKTAWDLEGGNFHSNVSMGGGRGGYSYSFKARNPLTTSPNSNSWLGDDRSNVGGLGARPLDNTGNRIFMGGGGGAGDSTSAGIGTAGGNGGGIVYIASGGAVSGTGIIIANGEASPVITSNVTSGHGSGGGGAGGSIIVFTQGANISNLTMNANGGKGSDQEVNVTEAQGPGGGGSGGYIATTNSNSITRNVAGGSHGITTSTTMTSFIPNGATKGSAGLIGSAPANPYSGFVPLPVNLKNFSAKIKNHTSEISWVTSSEINCDYYTVERSGDGIYFYSIGRKNGNGNSSSENSYHLIDNSPMMGISYYRLTQTDFDGTTEKFPPIQFQFTKQLEGLTIGNIDPNPFGDYLIVEYHSEKAGVTEIQLLNPIGQLVSRKQAASGQGINICYFGDLASMNKGTYIIQLYQNDIKSQPKKIVKD